MFYRNLIRRAVLQRRPFSTSTIRNTDFTHAVIGAGAVGLATARRLQGREKVSTILIEQHGAVGTETSSRNSEVIHAGLYYGADSLKTRLCIRGRHMLYELCDKHHIPYNNCGKWIVAQNEEQLAAIEKVHEFSKTVEVPTNFISAEEGKRREPDVRARAGILESPVTGILDSHSYMQYLHGDFEELGGVTALKSKVTRIVPLKNGSEGWEIWTRVTDSTDSSGQDTGGDETCITAATLINSAGLYAIPLSNSILPSNRHLTAYYAKGNYYSYPLSHPRPKTLIYPAPVPGHAGLGTHLTLDMSGRIRFGPDVQWVDSPTDYASSDEHLEEALNDIMDYLPGIDRNAVGLDYVGIRPKLGNMSAVVSGKGFQDFIIRKEDGFENWVNLLGIESPGLTSSLAIGEMVDRLIYK